MFENIKHCVPRRKTLTRRATAERWENTIFEPTIILYYTIPSNIYLFTFVCEKYTVLFFHELLKLNIERTFR
jgi:hypothetical protein